MFLDLIVGIFTVSNAFIALFIVAYAFLFLVKTKSHKDRRPWDYLFLASIMYLIFTMFLMLLQIYDVTMLFEGLDLYKLSVFFQFVYTGLILLAFISQTDLIFNNQVIIIMKKDSTSKDVPLVKVEVPGSGESVQVHQSNPGANPGNVPAAPETTEPGPLAAAVSGKPKKPQKKKQAAMKKKKR